MIKSISVDGLRSLTEFKLELNPGLNVLVGPNGSGKSNVLTAIELMFQLHSFTGLSQQNTIANVDIAKLFDVRKKNKKINIQIEGILESFSHEQLNSIIDTKGHFDLYYRFECEIAFQPNQQTKLFFSSQNLELEAIFPKSGNHTKFLNFEYSDEKLNINELDPKYLQNDIPTEDFNSYFKYRSESLEFSSILNEFRKEVIPFSKIWREFEFNPPYNIQPDFIRHEIEVPNGNNVELENNYIDSKGGKLLPVLLDIYNERNNSANQNDSINRNYADIYEEVVEYLKLTCPEVVDLDVSYNSLRNIIESYAIFENAKGKSDKIPLELMSDGTLKWLSLTTALLTSKNMFLLEEPENFIHPAMQKEFVDLMRATVKHRQMIGIFTTHSESILNSLDPSEVIVANFQNGRTVTNRIENIDNIRKKLQSTGFGLGWYYNSGAMDPPPAE